MKELPRYLLGSALLLLVIGLLIFNNDYHSEGWPTWMGHEGFYDGEPTSTRRSYAGADAGQVLTNETQAQNATYDTPAPVEIHEYPEQELGSGPDNHEVDSPGPTVTPGALGISCEPVADCSPPKFSIRGQFCQNGRPYTNVGIELPGYGDTTDEVYEEGTGTIEIPDSSAQVDVSYDGDTVVVTIMYADGHMTQYHIHPAQNKDIEINSDGEIVFGPEGSAHCIAASSDEPAGPLKLTCTGAENSTMYLIAWDSCSCPNDTFASVEVPIKTCGSSKKGGEACTAQRCSRGYEWDSGSCKCVPVHR